MLLLSLNSLWLPVRDWAFPYPLRREFYIECICNMMRPWAIVDYEREPWVMDEGTVRITFDINMRAAVDRWRLLNLGG